MPYDGPEEKSTGLASFMSANTIKYNNAVSHQSTVISTEGCRDTVTVTVTIKVPARVRIRVPVPVTVGHLRWASYGGPVRVTWPMVCRISSRRLDNESSLGKW